MDEPFYQRHAELVSASMARQILSYRWQTEGDRKVDPLRIVRFDEIDFPLSTPSLQLLLAQYRLLHRFAGFVADEPMYAISAGEAGQRICAMLHQPAKQIRGYANVERAIGLAGEDVDAWFLHPHLALVMTA
jgi:hypothetical protein